MRNVAVGTEDVMTLRIAYPLDLLMHPQLE